MFELTTRFEEPRKKHACLYKPGKKHQNGDIVYIRTTDKIN